MKGANTLIFISSIYEVNFVDVRPRYDGSDSSIFTCFNIQLISRKIREEKFSPEALPFYALRNKISSLLTDGRRVLVITSADKGYVRQHRADFIKHGNFERAVK